MMETDKVLVVDDDDILSRENARTFHKLAALNAVVYPITNMTISEIIDQTMPRKYRNIQRPSVKCALPGCDVMTSHRGGYCCPEHCTAHRAGRVACPLPDADDEKQKTRVGGGCVRV